MKKSKSKNRMKYHIARTCSNKGESSNANFTEKDVIGVCVCVWRGKAIDEGDRQPPDHKSH